MRNYIYIVMLLLFMYSCSNEIEVNSERLDFPRTRVEAGAYEEGTNINRPNDTYIFPAYPGTSEWVELNKSAETTLNLIKALQIPEIMISNISVEGLIHTYIDYPFADENDSGQYYSYQDVIKRDFYSESAFNGCIELMRRPNTGECLLNIYKGFDPVGHDMAWSVHAILLRIMTVPEIHSKMTTGQLREFVNILLQKHDICEKEKRLGSLNANMAFVGGRIMLNSDFAPFKEEVNNNSYLRWFLDVLPYTGNVGYGYEDTIRLILSYANDFIKQ